MANRALRTISVAYKELDGTEDTLSEDDKGLKIIE